MDWYWDRIETKSDINTVPESVCVARLLPHFSQTKFSIVGTKWKQVLLNPVSTQCRKVCVCNQTPLPFRAGTAIWLLSTLGFLSLDRRGDGDDADTDDDADAVDDEDVADADAVDDDVADDIDSDNDFELAVC